MDVDGYIRVAFCDFCSGTANYLALCTRVLFTSHYSIYIICYATHAAALYDEKK